MAKYSAASLTIRLSARKDVDVPALVRRKIKGQGRIYTFVEAVNYLLNSYATENVIAEAASVIKPFMKFHNQTTGLFDKALMDKALRCGNIFPEQCTKSIFVKLLSLNKRDFMRMYWAARSTVHLQQFAQYTGTLMQLTGNAPLSSESPQPSSGRRDCARERSHIRRQRI